MLVNIFFAYGNKREEVSQSRRTSSGDKLLFGAKWLEGCSFPKVLEFCFLLESENVYHSSPVTSEAQRTSSTSTQL